MVVLFYQYTENTCFFSSFPAGGLCGWGILLVISLEYWGNKASTVFYDTALFFSLLGRGTVEIISCPLCGWRERQRPRHPFPQLRPRGCSHKLRVNIIFTMVIAYFERCRIFLQSPSIMGKIQHGANTSQRKLLRDCEWSGQAHLKAEKHIAKSLQPFQKGCVIRMVDAFFLEAPKE